LVNVKDIEEEAPTDGDMLALIFARQQELEDRYEDIEKNNGFPRPDELDLDDPATQWFLKDAAYRVVEELSEATNCLKNKPWKSTHVPTDRTHFYEEVGDAFHFFVRFCIYANMSAEDLYNIYFKKSEVNKFRQETNY
jgi:hypothetical protein